MKGRLSFMLALALIGGTIVIDRVAPAERDVPKGIRVGFTGGVLACPIAIEQGANAYLHLANVGDRSASVRVSVIPRRGRAVTVPLSLGAGGVRTVPITGRVKSLPATAIVQYAGSDVVASHSLWFPSGAGGAGASTCAPASGSVVAVGPGRTLSAKTTLALANPGSADADVTITLVADDRRLTPERLQRRIVPARGRVDVSLGDFVFDARTVYAIVQATSGRVVAEALTRSPSGVSIVGMRSPADSLLAFSGVSGTGATLTLATAEDLEAALEGRLLSAVDQGRAPRIPPELASDSSFRTAIPARGKGGAVAYVLTAEAGSKVVAGATWTVARPGGRDEAALESLPLATRWGGVTLVGGTVGSAYALIANPGSDPAGVDVRILGKAGGRRSITLPAGRLTSVALGNGPGTYGLSLRSDAPVAVTLGGLSRSASRLLFGYAVAATPFLPPGEVAVGFDPRAGVAAPRPGDQ